VSDSCSDGFLSKPQPCVKRWGFLIIVCQNKCMRMKAVKTSNILFVFFILFLAGLTACERPGNVGLDVLEEDLEPPEQITLPATLTTTSYRDVTGQQTPTLAGRVIDPLAGTIEATGYFDVALPFGVSGFPQDTVTRAELYLVPAYVYGDTTTALALNVHEITDDWAPEGASADTTLATGPAITTFSFQPTDSSLTVSFPETWVQERDTTLRSAQFNDLFHGFALSYASGNAVVGFDMQRSELRLFFTTDSVAYPVVTTLGGYRSLTHIERLAPPSALPPDRVLLQDGAGPIGRLEIPFDSLRQQLALNRGDIMLYADTLMLDQYNQAGFVRPAVTLLSLYGVREDSSRIFVESARFDSTGTFTFSSLRTSQILQSILLGNLDIAYFQILVPNNINSINPVILYSDGDKAPFVRLIGTPTTR